MSRGPGRVERALRALFDASPDRAFFTGELTRHCFPNVRPIERKHAVATLRAARKIVAADPDWRCERHPFLAPSVFFNHGNLQSYAPARMIQRATYDGPLSQRLYREPGTLGEIWGRVMAALADPKYQKEVTLPDGRWWRECQLHCAERDGDAETAAALKARAEAETTRGPAELAALLAGLRRVNADCG
jgi:hypothetical protein